MAMLEQSNRSPFTPPDSFPHFFTAKICIDPKIFSQCEMIGVGQFTQKYRIPTPEGISISTPTSILYILEPENARQRVQNWNFLRSHDLGEFTVTHCELVQIQDIPDKLGILVEDKTAEGWHLVDDDTVSGTIRPEIFDKADIVHRQFIEQLQHDHRGLGVAIRQIEDAQLREAFIELFKRMQRINQSTLPEHDPILESQMITILERCRQAGIRIGPDNFTVGCREWSENEQWGFERRIFMLDLGNLVEREESDDVTLMRVWDFVDSADIRPVSQ